MVRRFLEYSIIAAAAFVSTQGVNALVITTYSDRTSWEAAAADFTVENFDFTPDTYFSNNDDLTREFANFSVTVDRTDHGFLSRGVIGGGLHVDLHGPPAASPLPKFAAFEFFQSINAFAMDLAGVGNDCESFGCAPGGIVATFAGPDVSISFNLSAGTPFFGLVSQGLFFDSLVLTKQSVLGTDNRDYFRIDNVAYSVAEPNGLMLIGFGVLMLVGHRTFRAGQPLRLVSDFASAGSLPLSST